MVDRADSHLPLRFRGLREAVCGRPLRVPRRQFDTSSPNGVEESELIRYPGLVPAGGGRRGGVTEVSWARGTSGADAARREAGAPLAVGAVAS
jgi:hypothetical protein